jgi:hypothetical protein
MVNKILSVIFCLGWFVMVAVIIFYPQSHPFFEKLGPGVMSSYILLATIYFIYSFDKSK